MSKKNLIPDFRFPEFKSDGHFQEKPLGYFCNYWNGSGNESGVTEDGQYFLISLNSIDIEGNLKSDMKRVSAIDNSLKKGDLVMVLSDVAHGNFLGLTAIIPDDNYVLNQRMAGLGIKDFRKIDPSYLRLFINYSQKYFKKQGQGSSQQNLSKASVIDFPVLVPLQLTEQQKIASCLSSLDELLAAHNEKLDALKDHKKGLMQNLFPQEGETVPKVRFPEFEGDADWVEETIDSISSLVTDYVANGSFQSLRENVNVLNGNGYAYYIRLTDLRAGLGHSDQKFVDQKSYEFLNKSSLQGGELLMANIGANVGEVWQMPTVDYPSTLAPNMLMIKFESMSASDFVYHFLQSGQGQTNVSKAISGSGHPKINKTDLKQVNLIVPPSKSEQEKIASSLSALDELITAQADKIEQLQQHKKGLMQGLFPKIER
jgi:type I restriction enzyme S subunit